MLAVLHLALRGQQRPEARWSRGLMWLWPRKNEPEPPDITDHRSQENWECIYDSLSRRASVVPLTHSTFDK